MSVLKNVYDKDAPTGNLVTTITGVVTMLVTILAALKVFTGEQAAAIQAQVGVLAPAVISIVGAISALILVFKAKD
jgi:hypothetical protein